MELSYKLDAITLFFQQDLVPLFLGLFLFMSGLVAMSSVIGKFSILIGRPVKWVRSKNEDHQLLIKTSQNLSPTCLSISRSTTCGGKSITLQPRYPKTVRVIKTASSTASTHGKNTRSFCPTTEWKTVK